MKNVIFLSLLMAVAMNAQAQSIHRCDGPGGKVTYAEICPPNTKQSEVGKKNLSVAGSQSDTRKAEADFQKRHAEREKLGASERAERRRAAQAQRNAAIKEEKMQREMALKEERAKRGESKVKRGKKRAKKAKG